MVRDISRSLALRVYTWQVSAFQFPEAIVTSTTNTEHGSQQVLAA